MMEMEIFIQNLGPVTRDQIHEFINDHNMPEGMQICNDLLAAKVIEICNRYNTPCILHNFTKVALELNHPYIHLPLHILENISAEDRRKFKVLGASCHSVDDALKAEKLGCTYITAGHIFDTDCKKGLPGRGLDFLKNVCDTVQIPVYAIGGINIASSEGDDSTLNVPRLKEVMECGAAGGCIMSGMMRV